MVLDWGHGTGGLGVATTNPRRLRDPRNSYLVRAAPRQRCVPRSHSPEGTRVTARSMSSAQFGQRDRPNLDPVIPPTTQGRDDAGLAYLAIPQLQSDATRLTVTMLYDLAGRPYQVNYPALASTHDTADVVFALRSVTVPSTPTPMSPHPG